MQYTTLGKTGLKVSVAGLGCGGNSRLGQGTGKPEAESVDLVRAAIGLGVNFLDTAEAYGTEDIVGKAVAQGPRDEVVISTKSRIRRGKDLLDGAGIIASLEESLGRLRTDHVDVFNLHAVPPADYDYVVAEIVPSLQQAKAAGKLRHIGITETSPNDPAQEMLQRAVEDEVWEVMMFAFHMMNQNARRNVFPASQAKGIGTLLMFVVRNIFSGPGVLESTMKELAEEGKVPAELAASENPLGFLVHEGGAKNVIDAAYRFGRHEPGADVVLFGTGSKAHLSHNIDSILSPPLPKADVEKLYELFGKLEGVGLDLPSRMKK
jgi:aryl-alcohol dehydrogenase-like predicted oxidoreductase